MIFYIYLKHIYDDAIELNQEHFEMQQFCTNKFEQSDAKKSTPIMHRESKYKQSHYCSTKSAFVCINILELDGSVVSIKFFVDVCVLNCITIINSNPSLPFKQASTNGSTFNQMNMMGINNLNQRASHIANSTPNNDGNDNTNGYIFLNGHTNGTNNAFSLITNTNKKNKDIRYTSLIYVSILLHI